MKIINKRVVISTAVCALFTSGLANSENLFSPVESQRSSQQESLMQRESADLNSIYNPEVSSRTLYRIKRDAVAAGTRELTINLSSQLSFNAVRTKVETNQLGSLVWAGQSTSHAESVDGDDTNTPRIIMVKTEMGISGTINIGERLFKIHPGREQGTHEVTEVDISKLPEDHPPYATEEFDFGQIDDLAEIDHADADTEAPGDTPNIRMIVAYDQNAKNAVTDINGVIQLAAAETNQGFANSDINAKVTLVHIYQTSYNATADSDSLGLFRGRNDGVMDEIHSLRDQHAADVAMFVPEEFGYCGQAGINVSSGNAYAVTKRRCATGNYSFGHELGHLLGAHHNPEVPGVNNRAYAYGYGYQYPAANWRTIMAYPCTNGQSCKRINYWSSPNKFRDGVRMGSSSRHDNARVLNQRAGTVANFRSGGINPVSGRIGPFDVAKGKWRYWSFTAQPGTANILHKTLGGSGDVDVYVRKGSRPTLSNYFCRSRKSTNNDSCNLNKPETGTWHIGVYGYKDSSGVFMDWSYN